MTKIYKVVFTNQFIDLVTSICSSYIYQAPRLTRFQIGSNYNYIPLPTQQGVQNQVYNSESLNANGNYILSTTKVDYQTFRIDFTINQNIGEFLVGEIALMSTDGTTLCIVTLPEQFTKYKGVSGNAFTFEVTVNLSQVFSSL